MSVTKVLYLMHTGLIEQQGDQTLNLRRLRNPASLACALAPVALVPMIQFVKAAFVPGAMWSAAALDWTNTGVMAPDGVEPEARVAVLVAAGK